MEMMSMEKTAKALLFFALLLTTFLIGTEGGRDVPKKDAVYSPQTFLGLGLGWPFLGGCPFSGFPGGLGLGGLIPGLGGLQASEAVFQVWEALFLVSEAASRVLKLVFQV
jgi:hypothetical protein